jgi:hypothetical protein
MKLTNTLIFTLCALTISSVFAADEVKTLNIGAAEVSYSYQPTDTGVATLTLVALVSETNNSLRGLKNVDQRRLSKLGQLIYQCKLMLYKADKSNPVIDAKDPFLISKNYSLFTGVDLPLAADERIGIHAEALQAVNDASLFTPTLGDGDALKKKWETVGEGSAINLKQFNVNVLHETDLIETAESIDIVARFPIFQLEKPVSQWSYNFNLKDFKQAIQHIDENCTPLKFMELINQKT